MIGFVRIWKVCQNRTNPPLGWGGSIDRILEETASLPKLLKSAAEHAVDKISKGFGEIGNLAKSAALPEIVGNSESADLPKPIFRRFWSKMADLPNLTKPKQKHPWPIATGFC